MLIGVKDSLKLFGVSVICCCAVLVCMMFLNYAVDLKGIEDFVGTAEAMAFYNAQLTTAKVVIIITGLCLLASSIVTLMFHVRHFIDAHKKELGILKALGYSDIRIASNFAVFGLSVLIGTAVGFGLAFAIMPKFYAMQNKDGILPAVQPDFHAETLAYFVILPTLAFACIAVAYASYKLKQPVLGLLKDSENFKTSKRMRDVKDEIPFLRGLAVSTIRSKKVMTFFICFSSFCFSAMIQMGASMRDLASEMMEIMMMIIGIILAMVTLILAVATVVKANVKTIAIMRAYGYSGGQCANAILGVYRPFAYLGFAIGTVYQFGLLKLMVEIVFKDIGAEITYKFDFAVMAITLAAFVAVYEGLTLLYSESIKRISLKRIMAE